MIHQLQYTQLQKLVIFAEDTFEGPDWHFIMVELMFPCPKPIINQDLNNHMNICTDVIDEFGSTIIRKRSHNLLLNI